MPDNEENPTDSTTELPSVEAAPAATPAPAAVIAPAAVVAARPTQHSTTRVILAAGAGALVVFLIAAAGFIGFAIGSHSDRDGGIRPARMAQLQENLGGQSGQYGPGMGHGQGFGWHQQGQQGGSQSYPQGQQGTMPQFPGQPGQSSGGMMGQVPSQ